MAMVQPLGTITRPPLATKTTTEADKEMDMKSASGDSSRYSSGSAAGIGEAAAAAAPTAQHSSWSAAMVADYESSLINNEIPPGITSSPSDEKENRRRPSGLSADEDRDGVASLASEEKKTMEPCIAVTTTSPTKAEMMDLASPKSSPFRQSLDEEHKAKSRARELELQMEHQKVLESKQLLRDSIASLSNAKDEHGHEVLTRPERNFLEMLLEHQGPGAAEACMAAHERLMDGNLFFMALCGGAAGEVAAPGHGWTAQSSNISESPTPVTSHKSISSGEDWVQDWVARGSQDSKNSQPEEDSGDDEKKGESEADVAGKVAAADENETTMNHKLPPRTRSSSHGSMSVHNRQPSSNSMIFNRQSSTNSMIFNRQPSTNSMIFKTPHHAYSSSHGSLSSAIAPYELQRKSSEARLARLQLRRKQSSSGLDSSNRLFRAHEAGLVVSQQGSARRSLMRMGLPMEKGFFGPTPPPMPLAEDLSKSKTQEDNYYEQNGEMKNASFPSIGLSEPQMKEEDGTAADEVAPVVEPATFEKALAKMDERTIRRIEKEERAKQKAAEMGHPPEMMSHLDKHRPISPLTADLNPPGCISPFSMQVLRRMFASKQFSFHRSSSSYTRFDSFLNSSNTVETGGVETANESDMLSDIDNSLRLDHKKKEIFRPSPRSSSSQPSSSQERLKNLLINAGFKDEGSYDEGDEDPVRDARPDDDDDILSQSTNSVAQLMNGGPSYRNVDMFRENAADRKKEKKESDGDEKEEDEIMKMKKKPINLTIRAAEDSSASLFSSLGSNGSPTTDETKESPSTEEVSPANSDIGELPSSLPPMSKGGLDRLIQSERTPRGRHSHKRSSTVGVLKNSSSSTNTGKKSKSPLRKGKYKRSVSWGHMVFSKEETKAAMGMSRQDSVASIASINSATSGLSVISFPNLSRAVPLRSDSIASNASGIMSIPPLKLGAHLRSDSTASLASMLSPVPSLHRAQPVFSPRPSWSRAPSLHRAHSVRSESQRTVGTEIIDDDDSLCSADYVDAKPGLPSGAAWESPQKPPLDPSRSSTSGSAEHPVFIRQASLSNYEGIGIEVEDSPPVESIDNARKLKSMVSLSDSQRSLGESSRYRSDRSIGGDSRYSVHSSVSFGKSWRSVKGSSVIRAGAGPPLGPGPPIKSLDDSFVVRNINFERHSSEILRSLSNEDLYSSHHLQTINGGSSRRGSKANEASSVARVYGDLGADHSESWDLDSTNSFAAAANAWGVLDDEYAEGYGAQGSLPFKILGTSANDTDCHPHVLSPPLMESLQNFMPPTISETNFWLKYSLVRDGASLPSLLRHVRGTRYTLIAIETVEGEVFGSFTSSPWRKNWNYYGGGEAFLWRMRRTRSEKDVQYSVLDQAKLESELDVFYWTGRNDLVQYCTHDMIAVGGGSLRDEDDRDDQANEQRDLPPDMGGFGLAIDDELLRGTSSPCATFSSPPLSKAHADGSPFEILNIEVWTMTPCGNVADAENLEMKSLFLEAYSREL